MTGIYTRLYQKHNTMNNINPTLWFNTPAGMDVILLSIETHNTGESNSDDIESITIAAEANDIYIPKLTTRYRGGAPVPNTHESIQIPTRHFDYSVYHVECAIVYLDGQIDFVSRYKREMDYAEVLLLTSLRPHIRFNRNRTKTPICKEHICKLAAKYGFSTFDAMYFLESENINDINSLYETPLVELKPVTICRHCEKNYTKSKWPRVCNVCIQTHGCGQGKPRHTRADISCEECLFALNNTRDDIRRDEDKYNRHSSHYM